MLEPVLENREDEVERRRQRTVFQIVDLRLIAQTFDANESRVEPLKISRVDVRKRNLEGEKKRG